MDGRKISILAADASSGIVTIGDVKRQLHRGEGQPCPHLQQLFVAGEEDACEDDLYRSHAYPVARTRRLQQSAVLGVRRLVGAAGKCGADCGAARAPGFSGSEHC
jgi:hypothetical protein